MNENLRNILREIETAMNEIGQMYERGPIYSSRDGIDDVGNQVVYSRTLSNGIELNLLNDASYSISGTGTEEEKRAFLASLEEIASDNSGEVSDEIKNAIYPIIDAVENSIENPEREEQSRNQGQEQEQDETKKDNEEKNNDEPSNDEQSNGEDHNQEENGENENNHTSSELEEYRNKLTADINLLKNMESVLTRTREDYSKKDSEKGSKINPVFLISTGLLISDIKEIITKMEAALQESIDKNQKIDIDYENDLKDALARIKENYGLLSRIGFESLDPKVKKDLDDLMKQVNAKMKELGIEDQEKGGSDKGDSDEGKKDKDNDSDKDEKDESENDETGKDDETDKDNGKLKIVFDARTGKYVLYSGNKEIHSVDPEEVYDKEKRNQIVELMSERNPDYSEKNMRKKIDPAVYRLLIDFDIINKTKLADTFVKAVMENDPDLMPVELKYILSRKNDLSRGTYRSIKKFAKVYDRDEIAEVENVKKEKNIEGDAPKKSFLEGLKNLGVALLTAVVNAGYNIKDVVTGKKKFRELVPPNLFKRLDGPEIKLFPKKEKTKNEEKDTEETKVLPKVVRDKKISMAFIDGQYALKTGRTFDSPVRYGDIVMQGIDPVSKDVLSGFNLSSEEEKRVDPTVYKTLATLGETDKKYEGIADRYVEAARKGETIQELNIDYDLSSIDVVDSRYLSDDKKLHIKELAKNAQSNSRGVVIMPSKTIRPEKAREVNEEIERAHSAMDYDKLGYVKVKPTEVYPKMDLDMARRVKAVISNRISADSVTDKKAGTRKVISEMVNARGIVIPENLNLTAGEVFAEIVKYDADMLSKDASYLMPEEKARANTHRDSSKGSKGKTQDKEEVK